MTRIGRYQFRIRTMLYLPAIVAFSWWLAIQVLDIDWTHWNYTKAHIQKRLAYHQETALDCQKLAQSPIPEYYEFLACRLGPSNIIRTPLGAAEIEQERRSRVLAAKRVAYHSAMIRKYARAAWFPWITPAEDPPEPS